MTKNIFVNLCVKDLEKSKEFYKALGFTVNPQFTNDKGACIVMADTIFLMILVPEFFRTFTSKAICDTSTTVECLNSFSAESREEVDTLCEKALAAGGKKAGQDQDYGFMYSKGFEDLDGHSWDVVYMDPNHVQ